MTSYNLGILGIVECRWIGQVQTITKDGHLILYSGHESQHMYGVEEALKSVLCDVIKIRLKRRIATRSGKGNQPLNNKSAVVEWPILKLG